MEADRGQRRPNHLQGETSPYLLQHLFNPVDWYPWGKAAHDRARAEDKPIFLSIGYAACHWCHVMERESFENPDIAELLNRHFISIKVDREERPDIDEIYMNAVQLMTGAGGWPLSAFLTTDLEPFFTGTYFPPHGTHGRPGFTELLNGIHGAWTEQRERIHASAEEVVGRLRSISQGSEGADLGKTIGQDQQTLAVADWARRFDSRWGGFGGAPKFPADGALAVLMREHRRTGEPVPLQMATQTLDAMAAGGIYDHVGGGFCRYSVDERWLVPHFEKMLYNQALLVPLYVDAYTITGHDRYRRVVDGTLDFVRRELTDPGGGLYSSLDADSEGEEGKFYVWAPDEVERVLAGRAPLFDRVYGIEPAGNFEGRSIPNLLEGFPEQRAEQLGSPAGELLAGLADDCRQLLDERAGRVRPATDDKVLAAWNGLMITAFARAYQRFGRQEDLNSAVRATRFVASNMLEEGRLRVSYRDGIAKLNAYLDDYAFFARGALDLYESSFDPSYLSLSRQLATTLLDQFEDGENGGFWFVSHDHETLITRSRTAYDGALPAGAGVAVEVLARLAVHLDESRFRESAERALGAYASAVERGPSAFASLLIAADWLRGPVTEVVILGDPHDPRTQQLLGSVRSLFIPRLALAGAAVDVDGGEWPMLRGKRAIEGRPTAFVCRDYACRAPVESAEALSDQLGRDS